MEAVTAHDVVVLCGETGCGKTTQPQLWQSMLTLDLSRSGSHGSGNQRRRLFSVVLAATTLAVNAVLSLTSVALVAIALAVHADAYSQSLWQPLLWQSTLALNLCRFGSHCSGSQWPPSIFLLQVPQFLLEAGYGCRDFPERAGGLA
eukprot:scaffold193730_cov14-Tisochrysis_lutea.AAC.1